MAIRQHNDLELGKSTHTANIMVCFQYENVLIIPASLILRNNNTICATFKAADPYPTP